MGAPLPAQEVKKYRYQRLRTPKLLFMLQQLQNKHHPLPAEVACFWCQFCILRLSKKTRQSGICKGNATVLQKTYTHPPNKNRQFFFHIVMHVLYCCSLERWQCVGFWLKEQHILNNKKKFRPNLKKQVFLGNTCGSGGDGENLLPGNCPKDDLLAIQEICFFGTSSD